MSDLTDTTQNTETAAEETATGTEDTTAEIDYKAEAEKWKALSRQNEATAKANAEKAKQFDALEEANKTEQQRLQERVEAAERALADKELEANRAAVALEKGLTASQAKRLVGSTVDELSADADSLLADLGAQPKRPAADLSQGAKGRAGEQSPADQLAEIIRKQTGRS